MNENEGSETPLSNNKPWFDRPESERIALIAGGMSNRTIQMGLDFFTPLNTGFKTEIPKTDPRYIERATNFRERFETKLKEYMQRYEDSFEIEAVLDGSRCYIFPDGYKKQAPTKEFVDLESLFFYLGKSEEQVINFLDEFAQYRGSKLSAGNPIIAAQLLAKALGKEVKVSEAIIRDDGVIIGADPLTDFFSPNPAYQPPNFDNLPTNNIENSTFFVNKPREE